ncbi:adenosine deaminase [Anaerorhabdus sp.]|uniref:adenosine deaminase n=1 Tax=Anaerorhabdus sp. TaxID=1872524 RepID=UPI002FC682B4
MKYKIPKIDLHCHLDGSIPPEVLCELAQSRNIKIPGGSLDGYKAYLKDTLNCKSLVEYLERFDFPIGILQDEEAIIKATCALIEMLDHQGLVYVELRFAPQQHTKNGLSQEEVLQAVLKAVNMLKDKCQIHVELILCMMNYTDASINMSANMETVNLAKQYLGKGVVLLDIAGAEGNNMMDFEPLFRHAKSIGLPYIIHAGEAGPALNVHQALKLGAKRIGHGVRSIEDLNVVQELVDTQVPIEVCISSNLNCFVFDEAVHHPIKTLQDKGVLITINTDNMMFSNTTLEQEYEILKSTFGYTDEDLIQFNKNSLMVAACDEEVKQKINHYFN